MNLNLYQKIIGVLENVQINTCSNKKFQVVLTNLYKNSDVDEFYECLEKILSIVLKQDPKLKNTYVEKIIDFCMAFCSTIQANSQDDQILFEAILKFLLSYHDVESDVVRFRVCQCIKTLLINLTEEELSEELCSKIENAMLERLEIDSKAEIRYQAICGMYRLQDALNVNCKIMPKFILHMTNDQSWKVRKICVEKIHVRRDVMVALILRTRDVNSNVRLAAFKRLSKLAKALKISERHQVIINGFLDSCKINTQYVGTSLITAWLDQYDNDYLKLIHSLRLDFSEKGVEESTKVIIFVLRAIFRNRPFQEAIEALKIGENRLIPLENLNWETAIYWRFLIESLRKMGDFESLIDSILPEPVIFATYIRDFVASTKSSSELQYVLRELFTITQGFDVSDTVNRSVLTELVLNTLRNMELFSPVVITVIDNLKITIPVLEDRIRVLTEFVSDLLYPSVEDVENDFQVAQLKVSLYYLEEKLRAAVQEEDYDNAALYKQEIQQAKIKFDDLQRTDVASTQTPKKLDPSAVIKSLNVVRAVLLFIEVTSLNPVLRTLNEDVITDCLADDNLVIRNMALECYGLCCVVDRKCAEKGISIFTSCIFVNEMMPTNNVTSIIIAIKAVCDLFVLYGQDLLQSLEDHELPTISPSQVIQSLVRLMDDENLELKECATVGLCNLILHGRVQSPILISRMILKWCNPVLDDESERIRQHIGLMLEKLPTLPDSSDMLENAVLPTIKTIINAPRVSPLADVNLQSLIKFMLSLCSVCQENDALHCHLALKICLEINDNVNESINVILSKTLFLLDMYPDRKLVKDLVNICDGILEEEENRIVLKNIEKFKLKLDTWKIRNTSVILEEIEE